MEAEKVKQIQPVQQVQRPIKQKTKIIKNEWSNRHRFII